MSNRQLSRKRATRKNGSVLYAHLNPWSTGNGSPEVKYQTISGSNINMYHNTATLVYNANMLSSISQGSNLGDRVGNKIFIKEVRLKFVLNNKPDRPNVSYRVVLVATTTASDVDTFSELFRGGTFVGPHLPANSILLHDSSFPLNQGSGMENSMVPNKERSFLHSFECVINKPVTWNSVSGSVNTNLSCYVVPYDAYGTLTTDNIASIAAWSGFISFVDA